MFLLMSVTLIFYQLFWVYLRAVSLAPFYINDMTSYIHQCQLPKFADDAKCFKNIATRSDCDCLQEDIATLFTWSKDSDLDFNLKKFVYLSFKHKFNATYTMSNAPIPHADYHKDLGLVLSERAQKIYYFSRI